MEWKWKGYGIALFGALNLQISGPEIWWKLLSLLNFRNYVEDSGPRKTTYSELEKAIPYTTKSCPSKYLLRNQICVG